MLDEADTLIDGRRIRFGVAGTGPALLLVPGNMMSMRRWVDAGYVAALADDFTVISFDPLGHGTSDKTDDPAEYATDRLVAHLVGVLDAAGADRAAVWGYSRGGFMTATAIRAHPDRFARAVVGGIPLFDVAALGRRIGFSRDLAEYDAAFERSAQGDWDAFWSVFPVRLPAAAKRQLEAVNDLGSITAATRSIRRHPMTFAPSEVPTLTYWGDDEVFAGTNAEIVAGFPTHISHATVPGDHAGAFAGLEAALAVVRPFLD